MDPNERAFLMPLACLDTDLGCAFGEIPVPLRMATLALDYYQVPAIPASRISLNLLHVVLNAVRCALKEQNPFIRSEGFKLQLYHRLRAGPDRKVDLCAANCHFGMKGKWDSMALLDESLSGSKEDMTTQISLTVEANPSGPEVLNDPL